MSKFLRQLRRLGLCPSESFVRHWRMAEPGTNRGPETLGLSHYLPP
jgi:hypothetical protein